MLTLLLRITGAVLGLLKLQPGSPPAALLMLIGVAAWWYGASCTDSCSESNVSLEREKWVTGREYIIYFLHELKWF